MNGPCFNEYGRTRLKVEDHFYKIIKSGPLIVPAWFIH